jgi:uncharacterized repeat protein (TIGR03803 family)
VFKITPSGTLTTLYNFCSQTNCTDGANPFALLIQGADGNFYGTASGGSANGQRTVFRITPRGVLKTLHNFCSLANCTDGASPGFSLVQATDGNFYGTTIAGGDSSGPCANSFFAAVGFGTVFKITPGGKLTTLHSFDFLDGFGTPGVAQATNGTFYGTNPLGGPSNSLCTFGTCGTVFSLAVGLDLFVETVPSTGTVGKAVTILGTDLADATHVFLPRQRNLWVTDTVEWCREARLA